VRALAVDRVTAEVVPALAAVGIRPILLKGPSIARWLYPSGGRSYGDTDLLVPPADFAPAGSVLEDLGFLHLQRDWADGERPAHETARAYRRSTCGRPSSVDLHRSLSVLTVADHVLWDAFAVGSGTLVVGGVEVAVLNTAALALHIVLHAVQHGHAGHTGEDLRRLLDALPLEEWLPVADLAARLGAGEGLAVGLGLVPEGEHIARHLGLPAFSLDASAVGLGFAPRGTGLVAMLGSLGTARAALVRVRWTLVPSVAKIRYVAGLPAAGP